MRLVLFFRLRLMLDNSCIQCHNGDCFLIRRHYCSQWSGVGSLERRLKLTFNRDLLAGDHRSLLLPIAMLLSLLISGGVLGVVSLMLIARSTSVMDVRKATGSVSLTTGSLLA